MQALVGNEIRAHLAGSSAFGFFQGDLLQNEDRIPLFQAGYNLPGEARPGANVYKISALQSAVCASIASPSLTLPRTACRPKQGIEFSS